MITDERKAYYWLAVGGLSVKKQNTLLLAYKSPLEILNRLGEKSLVEFAGVHYKAMVALADEKRLTERLVDLSKQGIKLLTKGMPQYTERLSQTEVMPPQVLYYRGNIELLYKESLAVVGTRRPDDYGKEVTKALVGELAKKLVIVTGHATGIDTYAAETALAVGGSVIIVAACGLNGLAVTDAVLRAPDDRKLIITEYEPDMRATEFTFPERNRLIAGISRGVAVIEAAEKSGAAGTARWALEQGRSVFAVPGSIFARACEGTNRLLGEGAIVLTEAKTVYDDFNIAIDETAEQPAQELLTDDEKAVVEFVRDGKRHVDEIINYMARPPHEVFALLAAMELDGKIKKRISNYYEL